MRMVLGGVLLLGMAQTAAAVTQASVRSIFLNGSDISSARSQELHNVDVRINENGDVFLIAPHYQVNEEDTYVPLSKYVQGLGQPPHHAPQRIGDENKVGSSMRPPVMGEVRPGEPQSPPATEHQIKMPPDSAPVQAEGQVPKAGVPVPVSEARALPPGEAPKVEDLPPPADEGAPPGLAPRATEDKM